MSQQSSFVQGERLFTPASHPALEAADVASIRSFLNARKRRLLHIQDVKGNGGGIKPISLISSVNHELLTTIASCEEISGVADVDNLTEDALKSPLQEQAQRDSKYLTMDQLKAGLKENARINPRDRDPGARIKTLLFGCVAFLRKRNWGSIMKSNPKVIMRHASTFLEPKSLRH